MLRLIPATAVALLLLTGRAAGVDGPGERDHEKSEAAASVGESAPGEEATDAVPSQPSEDRRSSLNLLGVTDTDAGESRRNENIQFNLIDNNALKELNLRLGTTATIIRDFQPHTKYFGAEFGSAPRGPIHQARPDTGSRNVHGEVFYGHLNSATTARSFFQVGEVKPAREHEYGFRLTTPLWAGGEFNISGGQTKIRGQV
ncbi:MAG: hypothetical protein GY953_36275, partial [bacterium]|nr:hypothetical protein [bacterium]